jgi:hypothetical protein
VPIDLISGSLNLLEPSGPVQACNGIALPFLFEIKAALRTPNPSVIIDGSLILQEKKVLS